MFPLQALQRNTIRAYAVQVTNMQARNEWGDRSEYPAKEDFHVQTLSAATSYSFRSARAQKNRMKCAWSHGKNEVIKQS